MNREPTTTLAHHPHCPMEIYWDVREEARAYCTCPAFWPRRVCVVCWQIPKRHAKDCPKREPAPGRGEG